MIENVNPELFLGKVTKVIDRETYEIEVEVPGYGKDLPAVPLGRGEMDEPVEGNLVIILALDPVYHSVNYYAKLKENKFVGIRSNGKVIDITPDYIVVGSDGKDKTNPDEANVPAPSLSYMKMDDSGNIEVVATADKNVTISGNCNVEISGNNTIKVSGDTSITTSGNTNIKSSGSCVIDSPDITIKGGNVTVKGTFNASGDGRPSTSGSFCGIPACLLTGSPHKSTSTSGN
jgi:hypothetical protein